jgi:hypothetical protein
MNQVQNGGVDLSSPELAGAPKARVWRGLNCRSSVSSYVLGWKARKRTATFAFMLKRRAGHGAPAN